MEKAIIALHGMVTISGEKADLNACLKTLLTVSTSGISLRKLNTTIHQHDKYIEIFFNDLDAALDDLSLATEIANEAGRYRCLANGSIRYFERNVEYEASSGVVLIEDNRIHDYWACDVIDMWCMLRQDMEKAYAKDVNATVNAKEVLAKYCMVH